jgi:hypothetical protein
MASAVLELPKPPRSHANIPGAVPNSGGNYLVSNNVLFGPFADSAIYMGALQGVCSGNIIDLQGNSTSIGIDLEDNHCVVTGNTIRNGGTGIQLAGGSSSSHVLVGSNNLAGCTPGITFPSGAWPLNSLVDGNVNYNPPAVSGLAPISWTP